MIDEFLWQLFLVTQTIFWWEMGKEFYKYLRKQYLLSRGRLFEIKRGGATITLIASSSDDLERMKRVVSINDVA